MRYYVFIYLYSIKTINKPALFPASLYVIDLAPTDNEEGLEAFFFLAYNRFLKRKYMYDNNVLLEERL